MEKTVSGVFGNALQAEEAIKMLRAEGVPPEDINVVSLDHDTPEVGRKGGAAGTDVEPEVSEKPSATVMAAILGAAFGAIVGLLAGMGAITTPGASVLMAAGPLAAALGAAAIGAAVGGLFGALVDAAAPAEPSSLYAEHINHGDVLVSARVDTPRVHRTVNIFNYYNAHEIRS